MLEDTGHRAAVRERRREIRKDDARGSEDVTARDAAHRHALCVERDAVCLVRLHPFVREPLEIPEALRDRIVDASAVPSQDR